MPTSYPIYPDNDFTLKVGLKSVDTTTGSVVPLLTGAVAAFLATSNLPTATAADSNLTADIFNLGSGNWLVFIDADKLDPTLMDTLFASTAPFLIIQLPGDVRVFVPLTYVPSRPGNLT